MAVVVGAGFYWRSTRTFSGRRFLFWSNSDHDRDAPRRQPQRTNDPEFVDWPEDLFVIVTEAEKNRISEQIEKNNVERRMRTKHKKWRLNAGLVDWPDELFD